MTINIFNIFKHLLCKFSTPRHWFIDTDTIPKCKKCTLSGQATSIKTQLKYNIVIAIRDAHARNKANAEGTSCCTPGCEGKLHKETMCELRLWSRRKCWLSKLIKQSKRHWLGQRKGSMTEHTMSWEPFIYIYWSPTTVGDTRVHNREKSPLLGRFHCGYGGGRAQTKST